MELFLGRDLVNKRVVFPVLALRKKEVKVQLDLVSAAEQHVLWKVRLGHHVRGQLCDSVESGLVGQDGVCQLGSWINGYEFHALRATQAYRELDFAHSLFHDFGAAIVEKLHQGDRAAAEAIFKNEYSLAMQHIIQALTKINQLLQNP
jgi:hypothetical protein